MKSLKDKSLTDRLADKNAAKKALLEKMKARPGPDDPAVQARIAERKAIAEARAVREAAKAEAAEKAAIEKAAREAAAAEERRLEAERAAEEERQKIDLKAALEAAQKRARDARYAARKARK
jgi:hypothetical protein